MRSKITVYIHSLRYRVCALLLEFICVGLGIGVALYMENRIEQITLLLITVVGVVIWHRQAFNYLRIHLKTERLIVQDDIFGLKVLNKPLAEIKKIRIERIDPKNCSGTYVLFLLKTDGRNESIRFESKYGIQFTRYKEIPSKEHYLSHDANFVKFEGICNDILKEYHVYLKKCESNSQ
ncbi:MAG: hypothetical protein J6C26_04710 [Clostridia bacterium]|nr:hypothetical protein [Clostridia bacterium]